MCGRFSLITQEQELLERWTIQEEIGLKPRFNIAPSQNIPVIINNSGENKIISCRWGFVPPWSKDFSIGQKMINARAETIDEKKSYKKSFIESRCIIPASGFYEWKEFGGRKFPHYISMKDNSLFGFAGIWNTFKFPEGGEANTCLIITTQPNNTVKPIHDRMPAILSQTGENHWLNPDVTDVEELKNLLKPYPDDGLQAFAVSNTVNDVKIDRPELIDPVGDLSGSVGSQKSLSDF